MLTHDRGDDFRRGAVFDLTPFGLPAVTFDLPDGSSLAEAVQVLAVVHADAAAARAYNAFTQGLCACHSNGVIVDAAAPLPADVDVVQFYVLHDALPSASHGTSDVSTGGHVTQITPQASLAAEGPGTSVSPTPDRAIHPDGQSHAASASAVDTSETSLYVVFDHVNQVQRRVRQVHWHEADCLNDAVTHSWISNPLGQLLSEAVPEYQTPQFLVYPAHIVPASQPVVFVFRGSRTLPLVAHVPVGSSVSDFFDDVQIGPDQPGHGVLDVPGGFSCFLQGEAISCHLPLPVDASVVVLVPTVVATLPTSLSSAGTGDTEALHVAREAADHMAASLHGTGLHTNTCFDEPLGPRFRGRFGHWLPVDCCLDCELTAYQIPYPVRRLLVHPVEGLPQPQNIVTDRRLLPTHRGIVVDLRAIGLHVLVIELVHGAMLHQTYGALPADVRARVQALFAGRLGHRFFVNGRLMNVALPLPPDTDVICVFPPAGLGEAADEVDMASAIWDDNPSSSHLSAAAGSHVASSPSITSTTSTTSTTTAMPTDGAFLSSDDDGLVPASERHQRKGEMQRRAADRAQRARSAGMPRILSLMKLRVHAFYSASLTGVGASASFMPWQQRALQRPPAVCWSIQYLDGLNPRSSFLTADFGGRTVQLCISSMARRRLLLSPKCLKELLLPACVA